MVIDLGDEIGVDAAYYRGVVEDRERLVDRTQSVFQTAPEERCQPSLRSQPSEIMDAARIEADSGMTLLTRRRATAEIIEMWDILVIINDLMD